VEADMLKRFIFSVTLAIFLVASPVYAKPDNKAKAKDFVKRGIELIGKVGEKKAFEIISNQKGEFVDGEFYLFVVTFEGITLAHGGNPALVGKSLKPLQDPDGVYFIQEFIKLAKAKGSGWVNYKWSNPKSKKIEKKTSYIEAVPGKKYFVGCGIYME
jgi:cytochrome c